MISFGLTLNAAESAFISSIQQGMYDLGEKKLSNLYANKLIFLIIGSILGIGICWASISRFFPKNLTKSIISNFIHHSRVPWASIHKAALLNVFKTFKIKDINLAVDDTDFPKCKVVKKIFGVFKTIDKSTGGFINAQNVVILSVITKSLTVPIFFKFYRPDPRVSEYNRLLKKAKTNKLDKSEYPRIVTRNNKKYPTRHEIFITLIERTISTLNKFEKILGYPIRVKTITADNGYVSKKVICRITKLLPNTQFVARMKKSQNIREPKTGKELNVEKYFNTQKSRAFKETLKLRSKMVEVEYMSARLFVESFRRKVHVIAMRYSDEKEFRFIFSTDNTYRSIDIIRLFALRWPIEVVFQDLKLFIGHGQTACQQGADGAAKVMFLSLLIDMFILTHSKQIAQLNAHQPLYTVGTMRSYIQIESLRSSIEEAILNKPDPKVALKSLFDGIISFMDFNLSKKHILDEDFPDVAPSPSLVAKYGKSRG